MITELINGYNVTGNHAPAGSTAREYRVCDASNRALHIADSKVAAIATARGMRTGDVIEVKPPPVAEIPPEVKAVIEPVEEKEPPPVEKPKPERNPATSRTTRTKGPE